MAIDLVERVPEWEREAETYEQKARALRQMIDAVRVLNGDAARLFAVPVAVAESGTRTNQYAPDEGPRGRDAVRRIVSERPGIWRVADIKSEVRRRGWPSSGAAIETAIKRLNSDGEAVWVGRGAYRFGHEPGADETEPESVNPHDDAVR
jgi:hypothetical protein